MDNLLELSLAGLSRHLRARDISPCEVLEHCLARTEATEHWCHAYVRLFPDTAKAVARRAESDIRAGHWRGPLHGVPVAVKDIYDMAGVATTASSKVRADRVADADSAVVARLKTAGAIIVGKTQTFEFAYGAMTPTTRNPWDRRRTPGGSSGGSAATVAAGGVFMATGTDTAGSIRIPSALCGTVGLKPTFGRVSRHGITPLSWSLDHAGPIARSVEDVALGFQAMAGFDAADPACLDEPVPDVAAGMRGSVDGLRVGVPGNYFFDHVDPEIEMAVREACRTLQGLGAELVDVDIPMPGAIMPALLTIVMAEASNYHRPMLRATPELYTEPVRAKLEAGELIPAVDYLQAQRVRRLLQREVRKLFEQVDVIVAPTVPATAALAGSHSLTWANGVQEQLESTYIRLTGWANLLGLPSLGMPCGFSSRDLPIGLQITGRPLEEPAVLRVGAAYEAVTDWHERRPGPWDDEGPDGATASGMNEGDRLHACGA